MLKERKTPNQQQQQERPRSDITSGIWLLASKSLDSIAPDKALFQLRNIDMFLISTQNIHFRYS